MHHRRTALALGLTISVLASACGDGEDDADGRAAEESVADVTADVAITRANTTPPPAASPSGDDWYRPAVGATWQWQLSGDVDTSHDVDVYDIDLFDVPESLIASLHADGRRVICYFSAGSAEDWRDDVDALAPADLGEPLDGWEGERWLDVSSGTVLDLMIGRLELARSKGCDGVEPDNVTAYRNDTGFDITLDDQVAFNMALADHAHARGLAIGLKNGGELIPRLIDLFDFSVNEECHEYDECEVYAPFVEAGKPVFNAEYREQWVDDEAAREQLCERASAAGLSTLVLPLDLDGSFRHACG